MNFASDNWAGAAPAIMSALARHNENFSPAYGLDQLTEQITKTFSDVFERRVAVYFVATGTAANSLALAAYSKPGSAIFCHRDAHIQVDECNCPEFMTSGGKLVSVDGLQGKMTPDTLKEAMASFPEGVVHHGQVSSVSISQASESGTVYSLDQIASIKDMCNQRGISLHMDGARFANALVSLGCSPAEMTWKAGVDVLSFGATKNGCWCAEAVVFFNPNEAIGFEYYRKRAGHLFSKSRFVAAQFEGYFENDNWLETAKYSNNLAAILGEGIVKLGGRLAWPVDANEVFPIFKRTEFEALSAAGVSFYEWSAKDLPTDIAPRSDELCVRMITSFATKKEDVERFLRLYEDLVA